MTELEDTGAVQNDTNGYAEPEQDVQSALPEQTSIDIGTGNAVAESTWDTTASAQDSWIEVPRDPTETETGVTATPAATTGNTNSWAEEMTEGAAVDAKVSTENDGFEQVVLHRHPRERGRGRGRGEFRGRGRGEGHRGSRNRGDRVEGGGRGRGRGEGGQFRGRGGRGREGQGAGPRSDNANSNSNGGNSGGW